MKKGLLLGLALLFSGNALADWQLNNAQSRLNFVSVKKDTIGEAHYFKELRGTLSDKGQLKIEIPLASVETMIPIRNERMQKMLFETQYFPTAQLSATIKPQLLKLNADESKILQVEADLGLHGVNKLLNIEVMVTKVSDNKLMVASLKPVILRPADFGLDKGVSKLQKVAGLPSITRSVPVNFVLTFKR